MRTKKVEERRAMNIFMADFIQRILRGCNIGDLAGIRLRAEQRKKAGIETRIRRYAIKFVQEQYRMAPCGDDFIEKVAKGICIPCLRSLQRKLSLTLSHKLFHNIAKEVFDSFLNALLQVNKSKEAVA